MVLNHILLPLIRNVEFPCQRLNKNDVNITTAFSSYSVISVLPLAISQCGETWLARLISFIVMSFRSDALQRLYRLAIYITTQKGSFQSIRIIKPVNNTAIEKTTVIFIWKLFAGIVWYEDRSNEQCGYDSQLSLHLMKCI